ncbi:MAG: MaoC family dehydratase [Alphaproteobacteria bacterium]|nr:MAG: MaoC family dehydratase [Alphaproteobacteria bacterium]
MPVFTSPDELRAAVDQELGPSEWLEITQERINLFAEATDDFQWIHVEPERAASGPFGKTIAHGFLTLSLVPKLVRDYYSISGHRMTVNYGLNKVRFVSPVLVGSRLRGRSTIVEVLDVKEAVQVTLRTTLELEGADRPACVVDGVTRVYF